ncbi:MAG TPA: anti-sigma regulatory factor [Clostridiaceae bacterium]|jgi:serine/threonine-protein kinase RsbW|nr:anti-sigma regulatory factor [Clostridiaceae bacterium]
MESSTECIELVLPFKAEYVSVARLTVSGIANRIGFDIEAIEDIKVAVSEVCSKLVQVGSKSAVQYKIIFNITKSSLNIVYACEDKSLKCIFDDEMDELAIPIINAMMDSVELCSGGNYILSMSRKFASLMT